LETLTGKKWYSIYPSDVDKHCKPRCLSDPNCYAFAYKLDNLEENKESALCLFYKGPYKNEFGSSIET